MNNDFPSINLQGKLWTLATPKVMGILNVTPDSFFDGGAYFTPAQALHQAIKMKYEGADMIDLGAYSSRPGARDVSEQEELDRLLPVLIHLRQQQIDLPISVDTFRSVVAEESIKAGAVMINDISGGAFDADLFSVIARYQVPYVLMHMKGNPKTMQNETVYRKPILEEIVDYFYEKINHLRQLGVKDILLDPGFGFAKTLEQNYHLLAHLETFHLFKLPMLGALSRKSMIYKVLGTTSDLALNGTTVLHTLLLQKGVKMLRVHDVRAAVECIQLMKQYHTENFM